MTDQERSKVEFNILIEVYKRYTELGFSQWLNERIDKLDDELIAAPMKPGSACDIPQLPPTE